jgi:hypothetical protein
MLTVSANKKTLFKALSHLGKINKVRVSRHQTTYTCKGYGYIWVKPYKSVSDFVQGCLRLSIPALAFPIKGPKHLGMENTKLLRRFARVEGNFLNISPLDAIFYLKKFGVVSFLVVEVSIHDSNLLQRVHVLYKEETSLLKMAEEEEHSINECKVSITSYFGQEEFPFERIPDSKSLVVIDELSQALQLTDSIESPKNGVTREGSTNGRDLTKSSIDNFCREAVAHSSFKNRERNDQHAGSVSWSVFGKSLTPEQAIMESQQLCPLERLSMLRNGTPNLVGNSLKVSECCRASKGSDSNRSSTQYFRNLDARHHLGNIKFNLLKRAF